MVGQIYPTELQLNKAISSDTEARYLTQDTNGKVTNLQWEITNKSQEASPFSVGDHTA